MFDPVSRRDALRRLMAGVAIFRASATRSEEWGEDVVPLREDKAPDRAPGQASEQALEKAPQPIDTPTGEASPEAAPVCKVTARSVEGPFYFDSKHVREDITEAEPGSPLNLAISVIDSASCLPIANARVDVWHANALGHYSGYANQGDSHDVSTKGRTFLRGTQMTRSDGTATFLTIYPGWYPGRAPHVHFKIIIDNKLVAVVQMYFPEMLSQRIYGEREPYTARGGPETANSSDAIFNTTGGDEGQIVAGISAVGDTITASLTIAVDQTAKPAAPDGGFLNKLRKMIGL